MSKSISKAPNVSRRHIDQREGAEQKGSITKLVQHFDKLNILGIDDSSFPILPTGITAHLRATSRRRKAVETGYTSDATGFADTESDFMTYRTSGKTRRNRRSKATTSPYGGPRSSQASRALNERKTRVKPQLQPETVLPAGAIDDLAKSFKTSMDTIHDARLLATLDVLNDPSLVIICSQPVFTPTKDRLAMASLTRSLEEISQEISPASSDTSLPSLCDVLSSPSPSFSATDCSGNDSLDSLTLAPIRGNSMGCVKERRARRMFPYSSNKADRKKLQSTKNSREERIVDKLSTKPYTSTDTFAGALSLSLGAHCEKISHNTSDTDDVRYLSNDQYLQEYASSIYASCA